MGRKSPAAGDIHINGIIPSYSVFSSFIFIIRFHLSSFGFCLSVFCLSPFFLFFGKGSCADCGKRMFVALILPHISKTFKLFRNIEYCAYAETNNIKIIFHIYYDNLYLKF